MNNGYEMIWRNKWLTSNAKSIGEMSEILQESADILRKMEADGVVLNTDGGTEDDYAFLITNDHEVAEKYGMEIIECEDEESAEDVGVSPDGEF